MPRTYLRYAIGAGDHMVSTPGQDGASIQLTDSTALALKFVTYERAESVARSISGKLPCELKIIALDLDF